MAESAGAILAKPVAERASPAEPESDRWPGPRRSAGPDIMSARQLANVVAPGRRADWSGRRGTGFQETGGHPGHCPGARR